MWSRSLTDAEVRQHVVGVAAVQHRVVPEAVGDAVDAPRGVVIGVGGAGHDDRVGVQRDRHLGVGHRGTQRVHAQPVSEQEVVARRDRRPGVDASRGVDAGRVAEHRRAPRLVHRAPAPHQIPQRVRHESGIVREAPRPCPGGGQPPRSSRAWGRSQWYSVATGSMPCARSSSTARGRSPARPGWPARAPPAAPAATRSRTGRRPRRGRRGSPRPPPSARGGPPRRGRGRRRARAGSRREGVPDRRPPAVTVHAPLDLERRRADAPQEPPRERHGWAVRRGAVRPGWPGRWPGRRGGAGSRRRPCR